MTAIDARQLRVGHYVTARFSGRGYVKTCEIASIRWPTFELKTTDSKGEVMIRERRYNSLIKQVEAPAISRPKLPEWLEWPKAKEA